jgi:hypothetical protein
VIVILTVIPKVPLTRSLTPRTEVIRAKGNNLWVLCLSHRWRVVENISNA